jgi:ribosomal protein S14
MPDTYWTASAGDPPGASQRPAPTARGTACESCGRRHAVLTLTYAGAEPFLLCQSCVAPGLDLVAQPVTSASSPTLQAVVPEGVW